MYKISASYLQILNVFAIFETDTTHPFELCSSPNFKHPLHSYTKLNLDAREGFVRVERNGVVLWEGRVCGGRLAGKG